MRWRLSVPFCPRLPRAPRGDLQSVENQDTITSRPHAEILLADVSWTHAKVMPYEEMSMKAQLQSYGLANVGDVHHNLTTAALY